jgi:hypothetical protein
VGGAFLMSTLDFATLPRTVDLMAFGEPRRALIKTRRNACLPPSSESSGGLANGCSGARACENALGNLCKSQLPWSCIMFGGWIGAHGLGDEAVDAGEHGV